MSVCCIFDRPVVNYTVTENVCMCRYSFGYEILKILQLLNLISALPLASKMCMCLYGHFLGHQIPCLCQLVFCPVVSRF